MNDTSEQTDTATQTAGRKLEDVMREHLGEPTAAGAGAMLRRDAVFKIPVTIQVIIGTARVPLAKVMDMAPGTVIPLEQRLGEAVSIVANGREIARGEVVVLDEAGSRLGVKLTEVGAPEAVAKRQHD
jgi:flagellar motor switch protein FliN/FliY